MKKILACSLFLVGIVSLVAAGSLAAQVPNGAEDNQHVLVKGRPWETDGDAASLRVYFPSRRSSTHNHAADVCLPDRTGSRRSMADGKLHLSQSPLHPAWLRIYRFIIFVQCSR